MAKRIKRTPRMKPLAAELVKLSRRHAELAHDFSNLSKRIKVAAEGTDALSAFLTIEDDTA